VKLVRLGPRIVFRWVGGVGRGELRRRLVFAEVPCGDLFRAFSESSKSLDEPEEDFNHGEGRGLWEHCGASCKSG